MSIDEVVIWAIHSEMVKGWLKSGIAAAAGATLLHVRNRYFYRNLDFLHVHVQADQVLARSNYEHYDNVLGIYLSNAGNSNVYISRAFFRDFYRRWFIFKRKSKLPIYDSAFKDLGHNAYEIKFGEQWLEFDTIIKPGAEKCFTYLPLSGPASSEVIHSRSCGTLILEYFNSGKSGRHRVRV
jgi:hypothetical protein